MMQQKQLHILLISPEGWGTNLLSKHHYARFLSENHNVFFLNPAVGFSKFPFASMSLQLTAIEENLHVVTYKNYLPRLNNWPGFIRRFVYKIQARRIAEFLGERPDLVWSFDPRRFPDQRVWKTNHTIYHSVDLHPDSGEQEMVRTSGMVVGISEMICSNLQKLGAHPFQTGHGCHVDITNTERIQLPGENKVKAIYTGNFHKHVDYKLLIQLAAENPGCDFILVGPVERSNISTSSLDASDLQKLKEQKNVFLTGSVPGEKLHQYLNAADICLVLFKKEFEDVHHAPHKLMAYFASGNVILANPVAVHKNLPETMIIQTAQEQIPARFKELIADLGGWNAPEKRKQRKDFAAANHYRTKISQILGKLFA